jgi:hypothetical protein
LTRIAAILRNAAHKYRDSKRSRASFTFLHEGPETMFPGWEVRNPLPSVSGSEHLRFSRITNQDSRLFDLYPSFLRMVREPESGFRQKVGHRHW